MEASFVRNLRTALPTEAPLRELWISSAYTSRQGTEALRSIINKSKQRHAFLGYNPQTEWQALQGLQAMEVDVRIVLNPTGGIFHPKCLYAVPEDGPSWVIAGSANLTGGGLHRNIEAGLMVSGPASMRVIRQAHDFFEELGEVAVPLSDALLDYMREAQDEYEQVQSEIRKVAASSQYADLDKLIGLDPGQAARLIPSGQKVHRELHNLRFLRYINSTKMEASYKMVILDLLLQTELGSLRLQDLGARFAAFYSSLAAIGNVPERSGVKMRQVQTLTLPDVLAVLKGAPREALTRSGIVQYAGDTVQIDPEIWRSLTPLDRDLAKEAAVKRLDAYFQERLGYIVDFAALLRNTSDGQLT